MKLTIFCVTLLMSANALRGSDTAVPAAHESIDESARRASLKSWKISILPLVGSQSLDAASSYGKRELNPWLAGANGGFEMKAVWIKLGATGALIGVEHLAIRKCPRCAGIFSKLNWASGVLTTAFAAHNFAIK